MRALLLILDGLGCGSVAEAGKADTLGHIFAAHPSLQLPALFSLGLWKIMTADVFDPRSQHSRASYGRMRAHSPGEHSITGHWEMAGLLLDAPFERFERFPGELVHAIEKETGIEFLGNRRQEQAAILREFGAAHCASGKPVLYASAGSAMEIAVHQEVMGKKRLDRICRVARRHARKWRISRVISHCFTGKPGSFKSGYGVDEYPVVPPRTVLNAIAETGSRVEALGKVHRLFAGSGITASHVTHCNLETTDAIDQLWPDLDDGLLFANLGDFDSLYGHQRDCDGYARALVEFDAWLSHFLSQVEPDDLVIITADHGNDPSASGNAHTREEVPLMVVHDDLCMPLGTRKTFADVAASLADFFSLKERWPTGTSFLRHSGSERHPSFL